MTAIDALPAFALLIQGTPLRRAGVFGLGTSFVLSKTATLDNPPKTPRHFFLEVAASRFHGPLRRYKQELVFDIDATFFYPAAANARFDLEVVMAADYEDLGAHIRDASQWPRPWTMSIGSKGEGAFSMERRPTEIDGGVLQTVTIPYFYREDRQ